jgi:hypothetical protein
MQSQSIVMGAEFEDQMTGCNASGYREAARKMGFDRVEVLNWTSSAGDWQFLVSKDGEIWQVLSQENNWPRAGFSYYLGDEIFAGTLEDVYEQVEAMY